MDINISQLSGVCDADKRIIQQKIRRMLMVIVALSLLCFAFLTALIVTLVLRKGSAENTECVPQDLMEVVPEVVTPPTTYVPPFDVIEA